MEPERNIFSTKKMKMANEEGFTLLELLISFVIIGIIVVIIGGAMRLAIHSVNAGEKRIDALERMRTSMNVVESQIQSQTPLTYDDNGEKKYYFQGNRESLQFSTNYSIWSGQGGYVTVYYEVVSDTTGKKMLKASENIIGTAGSRETMLFNNFDSIYFEYFFKGPTDENGEWMDTWTDNASIPQKIKLHLVSGQGHFSMIIPVRISIPQNQLTNQPSRLIPGQ